MNNLERAFRYPFSGQDWQSRFAVGGFLCVLASVLGFIPVIGVVLWVVVTFLPLGYAYRILRCQLEGAGGPPPRWQEWGNLFSRGWYVFLVTLGYGIVPAILYWLGKALWFTGGVWAFLGVLFIILGLGIGLVAFFLLPMALAFFVQENESFSAAFGWSGIVERIWMVQGEYFKGWLACLILFLALSFVRFSFLYVGWIIYAVGIFYLTLVAANLFGSLPRAGAEVKR